MSIKKIATLTVLFLLSFFGGFLLRAESGESKVTSVQQSIEIVKHQNEFSKAHIEPAKFKGKDGIAVVFEGTDDLHYYAKQETAPTGLVFTVTAQSENLDFGKAIFPKWKSFYDISQQKNVEVYVGNFTVFLPIKSVKEEKPAEAEVKISGIACTSRVCLPPFEKTIKTKIDYGQAAKWQSIKFETIEEKGKVTETLAYSVWFALGLAFIAGLSLNIMPCVWPVLPIIVMRIVEQAKEGKSKSIVMGLVFCAGILLFFVCLAGANIILQVFYGTVLQWGDQFRNPVFVTVMALLLIVLALFMFGVFTIGIPSSITSKAGGGKGYSGSLGMGFLAAILSTPCSFGILAAAFAWAQAQKLFLGTIGIMAIGVGMAIPYAIFTSMPGLLQKLPKAGRWMELFKQTVGFILLGIAVKLVTALPEAKIGGILYFAVVLSFCIWMWGGWVSYNTKPARKYLIRGIAILLAAVGGWVFLYSPAELIKWQPYDSNVIEKAKEKGRPVLIKFTADWCFNCVVAEKLVYSRRDVVKLIEEKGVLAIKADTTQEGSPATVALKDIYNEPAVPVSILLMPGGQEDIRFRGISFRTELKKALEELPDK